MKIPEFYPTKQGRPQSVVPVDLDAGQSFQQGSLGDTVLAMLRFLHTPTIDGGQLGDTPDACVAASIRNETGDLTEAMNYLYADLDGGTL